MMFARLLQQEIDNTEVKLSLRRFQLFPIDRQLHRVRVQRLGCRPHLVQIRRPRARVVCLHAQHQVRLTVDHQRVMTILLHNRRNGFWRVRRVFRSLLSGQ